MALRPAGTGLGYQERILGTGGFGAGKSTAWLAIARWAQQTNSTARFYVLDTDSSVEAMVSRSPVYGSLTNIEFFRAVEWEDYTRAVDKFLSSLTPEDWVVVDFLGSAWDAVQEWYVAQIYGSTDMGEFFMEARKMKKASAMDGWKDYGIINRVYRTFSNKLIHEHPAHCYFTAAADTIRDSDDKSVKQMFLPHGVRPRGQKHMAFTVHTVLYLQTDGRGRFVMNTIKDREREVLTAYEYKDFALDYLVKKAGWQL